MKIFITGASGFIGTNLAEILQERGIQFCNFDIKPPSNSKHQPYWVQGSILDLQEMSRAMAEFAPDAVIHMAARAECDESTTVEEGYLDNTDGTAFLLKAVSLTPSVRRFIVVSSQFVCGPGYLPADDEDYSPITVYGQSKVIAEQYTRKENLDCCWTLVRPTNIWGPWHERYRREFWRVVKKGYYLHPAGSPVVRAYGYVGNVCEQLLAILESPISIVNRQVFYLGDAPGDIREWVNAFSLSLRGRKAIEAPRLVLKIAGLVGDVIQKVSGRPFYINSSRYRSMISDYEVSMEKTFRILGPSKYSLNDGVSETLEWLRKHCDEYRAE